MPRDLRNNFDHRFDIKDVRHDPFVVIVFYGIGKLLKNCYPMKLVFKTKL